MQITNLDLLPDFIPRCKSVNTKIFPFICSIFIYYIYRQKKFSFENFFYTSFSSFYLQLIALLQLWTTNYIGMCEPHVAQLLEF